MNRKTLEGSHNPDRNAQFEHINAAVTAPQAAGQPVISIDTKKKELIGPYKNGGSDYRPEGCPALVNVHDFVDKELGKAVPYGVYDIGERDCCIAKPLEAQHRGNALLDGECPANGGIMPRWLTARSGWHAAEIGGPIQSRAFHCRPRSEPEAGDQHLFGTSASAATCSFAD